MRAKISYVQSMCVDCASVWRTEHEAQVAYNSTPNAYAITCAQSLERSYWMVMNREQYQAYAHRPKVIRNELTN